MEFTDRELALLSDGIIRLINDAEHACWMVNDDEAKKYIRLHRGELKELNTKICNYMEG